MSPKRLSRLRSIKEWTGGINRICHRSLMQTEKSQPEGKQIMLETSFTEFPALSVDQRGETFGLHRRPMFDYFSYIMTLKIIKYHSSFLSFFDILHCLTTFSECHLALFVVVN